MQRKLTVFLAVLFLICVCLTGCASTQEQPATEAEPQTETTPQQTETRGEDLAAEAEEITKEVSVMHITIGETVYEATLDDNKTTRDILANLPLELSMGRYAGHEYYSELPFTPTFDENRTSEIKAGHVYYWDGWNAFVINFEDCDITPYEVVHIGEITDAGISEVLQGAEDTLQIYVEN